MLSILGRTTACCDGVSRREALRVGGLSLFSGLTLPRALRAAAGGGTFGQTKAVILYNLLGGPSQLDMFDMKPDAPPEVRGEFRPIDTSLTGLQISEHLPQTARLMHKAALIRTMTHGYNAHNPLNIMTGWSLGKHDALRPDPNDPPDIGAVCQYFGMSPPDLPGAVCMPCYPGWGEASQYPGIRRPGPYGGYLGSQYDPLFSVCSPTFDRKPRFPYYDPVRPIGEPQLPALDLLPQMTADRLDRRRSVLEQIDAEFARVARSPAVGRMDKYQQKALSLMTSSKTRDAFDLSREPESVKQRYGKNLFGQSMLVARRLVEAGVTFVSVHAENFIEHGFTYDTHENNFNALKDESLPVLDMLYPAIVQDLDERGLLDSTLVVVMGEMGRSPKVNGKAGRDHWPQCGFSLLTGGGIKPGCVHGATDKQAAYPIRDAVTPADIVATIYHLLGIDPHTTVPDQTGRPMPVAHGGEPIWGIVG